MISLSLAACSTDGAGSADTTWAGEGSSEIGDAGEGDRTSDGTAADGSPVDGGTTDGRTNDSGPGEGSTADDGPDDGSTTGPDGCEPLSRMLGFAPAHYLEALAGGNYFSVMMADFTGDQRADVIITDHEGGETNFYWRGDAGGGFVLLDREEYGVGEGPNTTARGALWTRVFDFEGDGDLDWWWDDVSPGSLRINDGNGVFTELDFSPGGWERVRGVWHYDGDDVLDLVDTTGAIYDGNLVLDGSIGNNPPTLGMVACTPIEFHVEPLCPAAYGDAAETFHNGILRADFDGDGDADLLIPVGEEFSPDNELRLYRNDDGALVDVGQLPVAMKAGQLSYANAVAGDFDGDGDHDIAAAGTVGAGDYIVFENHGDFEFTVAVELPDGAGDSGKASIAAADFDGDCAIDLAVISDDGVQLYQNTPR